MKGPTSIQLGVGALGVAALLFAIVSVRPDRPAPAPLATASGSVSGQGFTLTSATIALPGDDAAFPDGPNADIVNASCTACHSASMALAQPKLTAEKWLATVTKMREVYHAPVEETDVPAIVAYLAAMPGQQAETGDPTAS